MKINSKDTIVGYPILKIRNLMLNNHYVNEDIVSFGLKVSTKEAAKVIDELLNLGLIERNQDKTSLYTYPITLKGSSLGNAKAVPTISRAKADLLFDSFMTRVREVNKNSNYLYRVSRLKLFGSYITDTEFVNDLDIGYQLVKKGRNKEKWKEKNIQQVRIARKSGVNLNSLMDDLFYTRRIILKFLKSKSPYISLHDIDDDGIFEIVETKQVFPKKKYNSKRGTNGLGRGIVI